MDRSIALLKSLSSERKRWEATSETFKNQMATIAGDVLLSSAFLAYAGMAFKIILIFFYEIEMLSVFSFLLFVVYLIKTLFNHLWASISCMTQFSL